MLAIDDFSTSRSGFENEDEESEQQTRQQDLDEQFLMQPILRWKPLVDASNIKTVLISTSKATKIYLEKKYLSSDSSSSLAGVLVVPGFIDIYSIYKVGESTLVIPMAMKSTKAASSRVYAIAKTLVEAVSMSTRICVMHHLTAQEFVAVEDNGEEIEPLLMIVSSMAENMVDSSASLPVLPPTTPLQGLSAALVSASIVRKIQCDCYVGVGTTSEVLGLFVKDSSVAPKDVPSKTLKASELMEYLGDKVLSMYI